MPALLYMLGTIAMNKTDEKCCSHGANSPGGEGGVTIKKKKKTDVK